jgi:CRP-like cAMP-binding protein
MLKARTERLDREKRELLDAVDIFKDVDEEDLKRLTEAMVVTVYKEGDILHENDDTSLPFCIVREGELIVSHNHDQVRLGQGDHMGEKRLQLEDQNLGSTVTAASSGVAYTIDCATFQKVFGNLSRLVFKSLDKKNLVRTQNPGPLRYNLTYGE